MNNPNVIQFKATSSSVRNPIRPQPRGKHNALFIIIFALSNLALLAQVKAVDISDTFYGTGAFNATSTGIGDSAFGYFALHNDTTGVNNTASGSSALFSNTIGGNNTANGSFALEFNTTGNGNTAIGQGALFLNVIGNYNTTSGFATLASNSTGNNNTASGCFALNNNTTANNNTANGFSALLFNTNGTQNTATGAFALKNSNGTNNTADGFQALLNNTGSNNIALGFNAGSSVTTGSNNIHIGASGQAADTKTIRIGKGGLQTKAFIQGIHGVAVTGSTVVVNANGQLGVLPSSKRFKDEIRPMDKASEAILALKPVRFRYKQDIDSKGTPQFGLVAEEVAKVNPNLVTRDAKGDIYTVRYEQVNAMLLNEFLKEHRKNEEQEMTIASLQKQVEALTAGLQSVSAQLEASKPARQVVSNP